MKVLPPPVGARQHHVVVLRDPAAGGELADAALVELAGRGVLDVLEAGLAQAKLRLAQVARRSGALSPFKG